MSQPQPNIEISENQRQQTQSLSSQIILRPDIRLKKSDIENVRLSPFIQIWLMLTESAILIFNDCGY